MRTHGPEACEGRPCCIHNPSDHHMKDWPQNWRGDRQLMERICPHGVSHCDPDHLAYIESLDGPEIRLDAVHGCDGCCAAPDPGAISKPGESVPVTLDNGRWLIQEPGESVIEANERLMSGGPDVHDGEPTADAVAAAMRDEIRGGGS